MLWLSLSTLSQRRGIFDRLRGILIHRKRSPFSYLEKATVIVTSWE